MRTNSYDHRRGDTADGGNAGEGQRPQRHLPGARHALADGQLSMEEHRHRVASATTAATLGDLQSLVADLQNANAPVQMPT